jgi:hypothetical protein
VISTLPSIPSNIPSNLPSSSKLPSTVSPVKPHPSVDFTNVINLHKGKAVESTKKDPVARQVAIATVETARKAAKDVVLTI